MMKRISLISAVTAAAAFFWMGAPSAAADTFPSHPIKIVVPFAAGGAVDTVGRIVGQGLQGLVGQPVVIDNKPGANANIGADFVAKAAPDGYTLLLGANGLASNMTLMKSLPFDTSRDFAPIAAVGYAPLVLVVPAASPVKTLQEFIAKARSEKDPVTYGTAGAGSSGHLASELFRQEAKFNALHVPYKGGAPALVDLVGGRIDFMLLNPLEVISHLKSGRLRALAITSSTRLEMMPDVPTFKESGMPNFTASVWWGFVAPAKTPKDIVARLEKDILKVLADDAVKSKLVALGAVVEPMNSAEFGKFLKSEIDTWARVIKASNITVD